MAGPEKGVVRRTLTCHAHAGRATRFKLSHHSQASAIDRSCVSWRDPLAFAPYIGANRHAEDDIVRIANMRICRPGTETDAAAGPLSHGLNAVHLPEPSDCTTLVQFIRGMLHGGGDDLADFSSAAADLTGELGLQGPSGANGFAATSRPIVAADTRGDWRAIRSKPSIPGAGSSRARSRTRCTASLLSDTATPERRSLCWPRRSNRAGFPARCRPRRA